MRTRALAVFTDYNEHSAVCCAKLGGSSVLSTVEPNPFRQPRAMPTPLLQLPQCANAFVYAFNATQN
jgi:hypothetical protein|eukprot:COSAG01_NODE_14459_length_1451_cov_1.675296_1_plen_67_part_00